MTQVCPHPPESDWFMWERLCGDCGNILECFTIGATGDAELPFAPIRTGQGNRTMYVSVNAIEG